VFKNRANQRKAEQSRAKWSKAEQRQSRTKRSRAWSEDKKAQKREQREW
jgi:hypothetical protein